MLEKENEPRIIKRSQNTIPEYQFLDDIKKSSSSLKDSHITSTNKDSNIKKFSSNHLYDGPIGDDTRSKSSFFQKKKKSRKSDKKNELNKNKKKEREKISKLLKNERLKIPTGKRMSIANNNIKLNLNNIDQIIQSLPIPEKNRLDYYGNKIGKENKKNVHITFLDTIPSNKLIEIIPIQSFKEFNIIEKMPDEDFISYCSKCCQIF